MTYRVRGLQAEDATGIVRFVNLHKEGMMLRMKGIWKVAAIGAVATMTVGITAAVSVSQSAAPEAESYWWCVDYQNILHEDWQDEEELPGGGPFYKAVAPQDKHADGIVIGSPCWDDGEAESHTEYQPS